MLSMRSLHSATVLPSKSYYTVVASIFLVSAASCKAIFRVASVRTSYYSQPFWLKVSWERGEVLGVSLTRAMARVWRRPCLHMDSTIDTIIHGCET